jgi:hypothetical protein
VNPTQLLEELQRREVRLWANGERLGFDGPPDVLTPPVLAAMKASKPELLALLEAQAAPVAPVAPVLEVEPEQVLEPASTFEPPEDPPTHPAWRTPATWNAQHGLWTRCGGVVPTAATAPALARYYDAKHDLYLATHPPIDAGATFRAASENAINEANDGQVLAAAEAEGGAG